MSTDLQWSLVTPFGILMDEAKDAWHTGHINDVIQLDDGTAGMLIASQTGGVWSIDTNNNALPLSDRWNKPDVNCLAAGPDGSRHFFAGVCGASSNGYPDGINAEFKSGVYEANPESATPLLDWKETGGFPDDPGNVNDIAVIRRHRRIIAACDNGLYWATIPQPSQPAGCLGSILGMPRPARAPFNWRKVADPPQGQVGFCSVEIGSLTGRAELAGEEALEGVSVVIGSKSAGAFIGRWIAGDLTIQQAKLLDDKGTDWTSWWWIPGSTSWTSVTVCNGFPTRAYLVTAYSDGKLKLVGHSKDGGRSWVMCSKVVRLPDRDDDLTNLAGDQGDGWNNCIAVGATAPGVVAIGWQKGMFVSPDSGGVWKYIEAGASPHLHSDVHVLRLTKADDGIHYLFAGSDGGLACINLDVFLATGTIEAQSNFNQRLPIIQCYATFPLRQFWGTLTGSAVYPTDGFLATGVQDNGNLYTDVSAGPGEWRHIDGGDGGWVAFVEDGGLLHRFKDSAVGSAIRDFSGSLLKDKGTIPLDPPVPGAPAGLAPGSFGEAVLHPRFRGRSGQHMVAAAASGSAICGLFVDPGSPTGYVWQFIVNLPTGETPSAIGSYAGETIFVASQSQNLPDKTIKASIFAVDSATGTLLQLPVNLPKPSASKPQTGGVITRVVAMDDRTAFGVINSTSEDNNFVIRLDGLSWNVPGVVTPLNSPFFGFDVARNREGKLLLFAATGTRVWFSEDESRNWNDISGILPERPHNADLRIVRHERTREVWLYLSTHGRSVWRAPLAGF